VAPAEIEAVIGPIARHSGATPGQPLPSPGMLGRHYAPRTPLECAVGDGWQRVRLLLEEGRRVGWLTFGEPLTTRHSPLTTGGLTSAARLTTHLAMPVDPVAYAAQLYTALHALDAADLDRIVVALPPAGEAWLAVHDRLRRAAREG